MQSIRGLWRGERDHPTKGGGQYDIQRINSPPLLLPGISTKCNSRSQQQVHNGKGGENPGSEICGP